MAETNVGQHYQKESGNARSRHRVERTCIGCRAQREAHDFVRFACTPQGQVILDASGRAPGRGVYVCCDVMCLRKALKPAKLALALKRPVMVPDVDSVYQDVQEVAVQASQRLSEPGAKGWCSCLWLCAAAAGLCSGTGVVHDRGRGHCDWAS